MESLNLHVVECEGASSVALSPEGGYIVLSRVGPNGAAVVMTNSTFRCEVDGTQGSAVASVDWSVDGRRVAAGGASANTSQSAGGLVAVCDAESGATIFSSHKEAQVKSLAFSRNDRSQRLALARIDGIIEILDAYAGNPLQRIRLRGYSSVGISPVNKNINSTPFAGLQSDLPPIPRTGAPPTPCNSVAFAADGDRIAVAHGTSASVLNLNMTTHIPAGGRQETNNNDNILPDDLQTILSTARLTDTNHPIAAVALPPRTSDPQILAFCGGPRVAVARADTGELIAERRLDDFSSGGNNWAYALSVAFCPPRPASNQQQPNTPGSRLRLVVGGELASQRTTAGAVAVIDAANGMMLSVHQARSAVCCVAVAADGRSMALGERRTEPRTLQQPQHHHQQQQQQQQQAQQRAQLAANQGQHNNNGAQPSPRGANNVPPQATAQHPAAASSSTPTNATAPPTEIQQRLQQQASALQQHQQQQQQQQQRPEKHSAMGNRIDLPESKSSEEDRGEYLVRTALEQHKSRVLKAIESDPTIAQRLGPVLDAECTKHCSLIQELFSAERTLKHWEHDGFMTKKDPPDDSKPAPQQQQLLSHTQQQAAQPLQIPQQQQQAATGLIQP